MSEPDGAQTFEELMAELEAVTERLAAGDLGIEAAADLYEQAERLHARAADRLAQVQARVEALTARTPPPGPGPE
jgi:exodeoxyribonuclease VII small subunit